MSMNPNQAPRSGLLGLLDRVRRPDEETGLNFANRLGMAASVLNPMNPQSANYRQQMMQSGQARMQGQARNRTIAELQKRAEAGDQVAARYLQAVQSGALDASQGFSGYLGEVQANERSRQTEAAANARAMLAAGAAQTKAQQAAQSAASKAVMDARKEFTGLQSVKDFSKVSFAYSRVVRSAVDPSPAGDLALIFNFMKVLDPGSVVREGEFATAQNSGAVDERVRSLYNQVREGTRLTETQRADFVDRAGRLYGGAEEQYKSISDQYEDFAKQAGINPSLVIPDFTFKGTIPEKPTVLQVPPNPNASQFPTSADWKNHWQNVMTEADRVEYLEG